MTGPREDLTGRVFRHLRALRPEYDEHLGQWKWVCECLLCGSTKRRVRGYLLLQMVYDNCNCRRTPTFARDGRVTSVEQSLARKAQITEMRKQGMSWATIGRKLGISRQRAYQIAHGKQK